MLLNAQKTVISPVMAPLNVLTLRIYDSILKVFLNGSSVTVDASILAGLSLFMAGV